MPQSMQHQLSGALMSSLAYWVIVSQLPLGRGPLLADPRPSHHYDAIFNVETSSSSGTMLT
jgi:hypothetical protein